MHILLQHELKKIYFRKEFFIAIMFTLVLALLGLLEQCMKYYDVISFNVPSASQLAMVFRGATGQAIIYCLLPMIVCIACADTYYVEDSSGVKNYILVRCEKSRYILSKALAIMVVSFLISVLPFILNQILCLVAFPIYSVTSFTNWPSYQDMNSVFGNTALFPVIFMNYPYLNNLIHITFIGVFSSMIGLFSFVLTLFIKKNRLIAVATSTVINLILIFIIENVGLNVFMPQRYLNSLPPIKGLNIIYFIFDTLFIFIISIIGIVYKLNKIKDEL